MDAVEDAPGGHIRLAVSEDLRGFTFVISNNGAPIPEELRGRLFEPGVSTKGEGHGLGLSIVRSTLAEFGGTISLGNRPRDRLYRHRAPRKRGRVQSLRPRGANTRRERGHCPAGAWNAASQRFLKNMVGFSMVTWISFALGFIATPISTRLFAPAELARVSMFGTYTSLFCSVCYLGLDQAFVRFFPRNPRPYDPPRAFDLLPVGGAGLRGAVLGGAAGLLALFERGDRRASRIFPSFCACASTAARWSFSASCRCATGWNRTRCSTPSRAWCTRC